MLILFFSYPYNVMNCLLAASPTLSLRTYTICTALSLFKVIIHSSLGASIHSFKDYHMVPEGDSSESYAEETRADTVARLWTIIGIIMSVAILGYISYIARVAVDEELERDGDEDETVAFLSPRGAGDLELGDNIAEDPVMTESPFHTHQLLPTHVSLSPEALGRRL